MQDLTPEFARPHRSGLTLPEKRTILLLAGVLLASALAPLGSTSIAVAMPQISQFMGMNIGTTTQLLVGGYLLISVIGQAPAGKLGDIIGYQKALYIGLTIFMLGSLLGLLLRFLQNRTMCLERSIPRMCR